LRTRVRGEPGGGIKPAVQAVSKLVEYRESLKGLPEAERRLAAKQKEVEEQRTLAKSADKAISKKANEAAGGAKQAEELAEAVTSLRKVASVEQDSALSALSSSATSTKPSRQTAGKLHRRC
jgi:hypothetical protein